MAKKNTRTLKFEALDKELQNLLYSRDISGLISVLKEEKNPLLLEQLNQLDVKSCENLGFPVLWSLYENDFIPFEEDFLLEKLCDALFLMSKHKEIESFILKRPRIAKEIGEKLPFYFLEKRHIYVTEYEKLLDFGAKGFFKGTQVVPNFLEALLSPMKTYTANTYCSIIESCKPTTEELLPSQQTLFALLSSDKTSVVNFVMKLIKQIADEKDFDFQAFADNFALCFTTQKIAKSQLIGLNILEKYYKKQAPTNPDYREQLAVLFTVPDVKLQEKVTNLLTTYFGGEGLAEVVAPYQDYLKEKAQDLLATLSLSENSENSQTACVDSTSQTACATRSLPPITYPLGPEDLLFLLGDCLRERTAATIDLFFEGLVQLQDQLPENFKEQLAPYIAQVNGMYYFNVQLAALQLLLAGWVEDRPLESPEEWKKMNTQVRRLNTEEEEPFKQACVLHNVWYLRDEIPYLLYKVKATLSKLKSGSKLPFLSTPTHAPFYIDAETLADRLLAYQTAGKEVDLDDLVVACNRLLLSTITPEVQEKVRSLSGQYAPALGYLFGLSDVVTPTEEFLPLWTQITRLKHPDKVFIEFETTTAKDYLSAVKPFFLSYEIDSELKWFYLEKKYINSPYNDYQRGTFEKEEDRLPYNYYNAGAFQIFDVDTLRYTISLNPQYVDVLLGKYTPPWVGVSDAETYRNLQVPLQLLLEYDLPVHHGGWIFIGMALLHDKKETRDLAAEYILRAISRDEDLSYLQHFLADILAQKLTPINRFVEFLDIPTRDPKIKAFQKAVVEAYLPLAEKQEKKPTNHKKLANWLIS
ncbi:DUF6493 family protein [Capnocytophaga gingivalis]|uniref:DUF6493 family protein n=1 Tax=Capnocytophaga gingivalis TaxID=1017 RepID=UPI0028EFBD61|nr:DUF6493 family protein [Capnocytophaga gingivalis]